MPDLVQLRAALTALAHPWPPLFAAAQVSFIVLVGIGHASRRLMGTLRRLFGDRGRRGADLKGINLARADLSSSHLESADLRGANLKGANLQGANLRGANLRGADLRRANLESVDLRRANLTAADLLGAHLGGADLRGADLRKAYVKYAVYDRTTLWPHGFDPVAAGAMLVEQRERDPSSA